MQQMNVIICDVVASIFKMNIIFLEFSLTTDIQEYIKQTSK